MTTDAAVSMAEMKKQALAELTGNILPYWMNRMADNDNGGFLGRIDGMNNIIPGAPKGAILNARILWTFSAAYRFLNNPLYLQTAERAWDYINGHFFDREYGGTYWLLNSDGTPRDTRKQIYSQAFFIYALSEYYLATGDKTILDKAVGLFHLIETHSFDREKNGYLEAFDRRWGYLEDLRLSEKDANEKKTMNTHLHVLEAYTNLYRAWPDTVLRAQLMNLAEIFIDRIIDRHSRHLNLFFDEDWNCKSSVVSFGHDIEASWLIHEAAEVLGERPLAERTGAISTEVAIAAMEGLQADGSLIYEVDSASGHADHDRHWWVQAEAVVGFINAWQTTGDREFLSHAKRCFSYIMTRLVDTNDGEWFWSIRADGSVNMTDDKAGFWKCPYHNSRMCLQILTRTESQKT